MRRLTDTPASLIFVFSLVLVLFTSCGNSTRPAAPENIFPDFETQKAVEDDESAVYATVLRSVARFPSVVLSETNADERAAEVLANNGGRFNDPEVLESFKRNNAKPKSLIPYVDRSKYLFISEEDDKELFGGQQIEKWNAFKATKKIEKIIHLSGIGFDHSRTTAVVNVDTSCGWTCGTLDLYILRKSDFQTWSIEGQISLGIV